MKIDINNDISFKTNIVFLSPRGMMRVVKKMRKNDNYMQIDKWFIKPPGNEEKLKGYRTNCSLVYTYGVRSCSSGVSVKKGENAPYFWHIEDTKENIDNIKQMRDITKCDNVILFGSKSKYHYSPILFRRFENFIKKDKVPATIMKNIAPSWEAYSAYNAKNDTLFMCVREIEEINKRVNSMKKLKEVFETVTISPTDKLYFPNFIQELLLTKKLNK